MGKRYTTEELDARLKFALGMTLGSILFMTAVGILYALIFVTQPIGAQSENDKMFFNVLGSIATFITGTLAGILIGQNNKPATPSKEDEEPDLFEEGEEQQ
jgi:formate hydrogenlyase subunit 3/multisubunit Na+/H+ antiporter MnhD subunit